MSYRLMIGLVLIFCPSAVMGEAADVAGGADMKSRYTAYALGHDGDAAAGGKLFLDKKRLACVNCHAITGLEKSGPSLDGIADKYPRDQIIHHVLNPSAFIQPGYELLAYTMRDGKVHAGRIRIVTKIHFQLLDAASKRVNVKRADVVEMQELSVSMMPEGLVAAISESEFADLIAYLGTLSTSEVTGFKGKDEPVEIPTLATPVEFVALRGEDAKFVAPVWFGNIPGVNQSAVVEHQHGRIWRLTEDAKGEFERHLFLDLGDEVSAGGNTGLMCIAFHPKYAENRLYYLEYEVKEGGKLITTIAERKARTDGLADSGRPSRRLLEVEQPAGNHNGGCIAFGNDGMLYAGFGDGGPQYDPPGHSQNGEELLGSMIRIDVDGRTGDLPYGIPTDNPFVGKDGYRDEIWAMGFREPWRFSFDKMTGDLWLGDVGQHTYEEVAIVRSGENHGWNVIEGYVDYSEEYRRAGEKYTYPVFVYPHKFGVSVTGGYVYRGDQDSPFYGMYVFADYESKRVWALRQMDRKMTEIVELGRAPDRIASFGEDAAGNLYVVGYLGEVYRIDFESGRVK